MTDSLAPTSHSFPFHHPFDTSLASGDGRFSAGANLAQMRASAGSLDPFSLAPTSASGLSVHPSQLHGNLQDTSDTGTSNSNSGTSSNSDKNTQDNGSSNSLRYATTMKRSSDDFANHSGGNGGGDGGDDDASGSARAGASTSSKSKATKHGPASIGGEPKASTSRAAHEDEPPLTPAEARRLKRKEQNRMAQRRHREKQRSQLKKQRQSSTDGSPLESDTGETVIEAASNHNAQSSEDLQVHNNTFDGPTDATHQGGMDMTSPQFSHPYPQTQDFHPNSGPPAHPPQGTHDMLSSMDTSHSGQHPDHSMHAFPHQPHHSHDHGLSSMHVPSDQFDYSQLLLSNKPRSDGITPSITTGTSMSGILSPSFQTTGSPRSEDGPHHAVFAGHSGGAPVAFTTDPFATSADRRMDHQQQQQQQHFQHSHDDQRDPFARDDHDEGDARTEREEHARRRHISASQLPQGPQETGAYHGGMTSHSLVMDSDNNLASQQVMPQRTMSNTELMKYFASLTSVQMPWADRLLMPRWDLIKVLELASARLGLMFEYVEGDHSISFLAADFLAATRGLGRGDAVSGPGQTELNKWPTEDDPHMRVPPPRRTDTGDVEQSGSELTGGDAAGGNGAAAGPVLRWSHVPENMRPTQLSGVVPHHPYIDLSFPWPIFRDRILAAMSCRLLHEVDLCMEIWPGEDFQPVGAEPPYWIHGDDPFDPESYEVSDRFAKRYPWLLDPWIIRRTNWWRRQQGKTELPSMVAQVSHSFAPFFQQQIQHLVDPEHVLPPSRLPQALNHLGIGSVFPPLGQIFGVNAQADFFQAPRGSGSGSGSGTDDGAVTDGAMITTLNTGNGHDDRGSMAQ